MVYSEMLRRNAMQKEKLDFLTAKARKLRDDAIEIIGH